jgi:hypothetical protein
MNSAPAARVRRRGGGPQPPVRRGGDRHRQEAAACQAQPAHRRRVQGRQVAARGQEVAPALEALPAPRRLGQGDQAAPAVRAAAASSRPGWRRTHPASSRRPPPLPPPHPSPYSKRSPPPRKMASPPPRKPSSPPPALAAKSVPINWVTSSKPYADQALTCGSRLSFSWNMGMHNLLQATTSEWCSSALRRGLLGGHLGCWRWPWPAGRLVLAPAASSAVLCSGRWRPGRPACRQPGSVQTASPCVAHAPDPRPRPLLLPLPPPADTCDTAKATQLVGVVSKGSYNWTATKNGVYYLICTVGTVGGGERSTAGVGYLGAAPAACAHRTCVYALCSPHRAAPPLCPCPAALHGSEHEDQGHRVRLQVTPREAGGGRALGAARPLSAPRLMPGLRTVPCILRFLLGSLVID